MTLLTYVMAAMPLILICVIFWRIRKARLRDASKIADLERRIARNTQ